MAKLELRKLLRQKKRRAAPGASPGTLILPAAGKKPVIKVIAFSGDLLEERELASVSEIKPYLENPERVCWFDIRGLGDELTLREIASLFKIHPLALEDIVHTPQRPKSEEYPSHLFIIARMLFLRGHADMEAEQVNIFLGEKYVLTIQEKGEDCFEPVRQRIRKRGGVHRRSGADYLCYSLLDAIIDNYYPVLEQYGEYLELLESQTVALPNPRTLKEIHAAKRELLELRRVLFPQRDVINQLIRGDSELLSSEVRLFMRDCYDHAIQVMDMVETYREIVSGLHDVYLSSIGNRTNQVMKVLTIISTIFIPLTFVAGVYGMNFNTQASSWNMPELNMRYGYPITMLAMLALALGLVYYFWRKKWIFSGDEMNLMPHLTDSTGRDVGPAKINVGPTNFTGD